MKIGLRIKITVIMLSVFPVLAINLYAQSLTPAVDELKIAERYIPYFYFPYEPQPVERRFEGLLYPKMVHFISKTDWRPVLLRELPIRSDENDMVIYTLVVNTDLSWHGEDGLVGRSLHVYDIKFSYEFYFRYNKDISRWLGDFIDFSEIATDEAANTVKIISSASLPLEAFSINIFPYNFDGQKPINDVDYKYQGNESLQNSYFRGPKWVASSVIPVRDSHTNEKAEFNTNKFKHRSDGMKPLFRKVIFERHDLWTSHNLLMQQFIDIEPEMPISLIPFTKRNYLEVAPVLTDKVTVLVFNSERLNYQQRKLLTRLVDKKVIKEKAFGQSEFSGEIITSDGVLPTTDRYYTDLAELSRNQFPPIDLKDYSLKKEIRKKAEKLFSDGKPLQYVYTSFFLSNNIQYDSYKKIGDHLAGQYAQVGIDVQEVFIPNYNDFLRRLKESKFDIALIHIPIRYNNLGFYFNCRQDDCWSDFFHPTKDLALESLFDQLDYNSPEDLGTLFMGIQEKIIQKNYMVYLFEVTNFTMYRSKIVGFQTNFTNYYQEFYKWDKIP